MSERLIDANALLNSMCCLDGETQCDAEDCIRHKERKYIEAAPTIDAKPVRHGRWENGYCTNCKRNLLDLCGGEDYELAMYAESGAEFCPFCGADMREGVAENG